MWVDVRRISNKCFEPLRKSTKFVNHVNVALRSCFRRRQWIRTELIILKVRTTHLHSLIGSSNIELQVEVSVVGIVAGTEAWNSQTERKQNWTATVPNSAKRGSNCWPIIELIVEVNCLATCDKLTWCAMCSQQSDVGRSKAGLKLGKLF